jgi:uncharacterized HAD superfamily protein
LSEWENLPPTVEPIRWLDKIVISSIEIISKSEKAGLEYDLFIDDSPITALSVSKKGKICLLYDQPWNRNVHDNDNNNIIRINRLSEAASYIKNKHSIY